MGNLCKLSEQEIKKLKKKQDKSPKYYCKKCDNKYHKEKKLCKPEKL